MRFVEVLLCGGLLACVPFLLAYGRRRWAAWMGALAALGAAFGAGHVWQPERDAVVEQYQPRLSEEKGFASSKSCRNCHPGEFESWHRTWHRTMTQFPSPETVVGEFDGRELNHRNRRYIVERRGDEFWVRMPDPEWEQKKQQAGGDLDTIGIDDVPMVERQVLLLTGSHRMQTYWVASEKDSILLQFPWFYHRADRRWIPAEDTFLTPPGEPRGFTEWNTNCIRCHTTNPVPGEDRVAQHVRSRATELGISCEACHGPAEEHIRVHSSPVGRYAERLAAMRTAGASQPDDRSDAVRPPHDEWHDPTIVNPVRLAHNRASEICGQCHSVFAETFQASTMRDGYRYHAGDDVSFSRRMVRFGRPDAALVPEEREKYLWLDSSYSDYYFWRDGTPRAAGDEFNSLLETPCYQRGTLACISCHSMHDAPPRQQVKAEMRGNQACIQCHTEFSDESVLTAHTHHPAGSAGSHCYNCHMPRTSYGLYSATRSHRIDVPTVAMSTKFGRPNACNLCHIDQTLEWTGEKLAEWYRHPVPELEEEQREVSAALLWMLRGDAAQRIIAAWHMGWDEAHNASGSDWQAPFLAELLDDPYSAVRYVAEKALRTLPGQADLEYDFLAPSEARRAARDRSVAAWNNQLKSRSASERSAADAARLLLDVDGSLQQDRLADLLKQRDDTPVEIKE